MGDKCKLIRHKAPSVGDKCGRQVQIWETSVNSCGARHPDSDASPETKAKSCGPGMQPFEMSKNPIQETCLGKKEVVLIQLLHPCDRRGKLSNILSSQDLIDR